MRYRLGTLLLVIALIALVMGWWRDRAQLSSQIDVQRRQIRQLQQQLEDRSFSFFGAPGRFKTPDEVAAFVERATDDEFSDEDWSWWGNSHVALQSVARLIELLDSPNEEARHHAVILLGWIGQARRPPDVDPTAALVARLSDPSSTVRGESFAALGYFGPLAKGALGELRRIMDREQTDREQKYDAYFAALAVKKIDPTVDIGPKLRELFLSGEEGLWQQVGFQLADHLPAAEARQLLMAKSQQDTASSSRDAIAQALNRIKD